MTRTDAQTTFRLEEDHPTGLFDEIEVIAVMHNGEWRLHDRSSIYKEQRVSGIL